MEWKTRLVSVCLYENATHARKCWVRHISSSYTLENKKKDAFVECKNKRKRSLRIENKKKSYLVDPASSHMLVSKIKPCMSKHTP